ncbi:hypothetical protein Nepgr_023841 [Nepenthes gracilis]|uniref:Protein kinase domain-containing protein n=1 Tax=Nepenthes gracilis TaxID=150966 RepID=A0AAD3T2W1_NEPGR|nr:hypothetical protein Nepgr_023841 [Nepenthes gracilis]
MGGDAAPSRLRVPPPSSSTRPPRPPLLQLLLLVVHQSFAVAASDAANEAEALVKFRDSLHHNEAIPNWNPSTAPCSGDSSNWVGVICLNGSVWGLQLENMGLSGKIDVDELTRLNNLRTLSIMNNKFQGEIPDLRRLTKLRSIYLSNNQFSGEIPDDGFSGMTALRRLFLANNSFTGKIPTSLTTLPRLVELRLEGNRFEGGIPNFEPLDSLALNAANNQLEGPIPPGLRNLSANSFSGNKGLCGPPLGSCTTISTATSTASGRVPSTLSTTGVVLSVLLALAILALIIAAALYYHRREAVKTGRTMSSNRRSKLQHTMETRRLRHAETKKMGHGRLVFVREDREEFDLPELLTASAEVLGCGSFGSSYKAVMSGSKAAAVVVKRFRQMSRVGRQGFFEHLKMIGRLRHRNLLPVVACYYRKEEKLIISDFAENGSLAYHLHGNRNMNNPVLDWSKRLRVIKGVARGLAYLYNQLPGLVVAHGHLKSSNVLLDSSFEPLLADYALLPLINPEHAQQLMVAYKSPEYTNHNHITKKTDVWGLGILILETLTGKFPINYVTVGSTKGVSSASWVNAIAIEQEQSEHHWFDREMEGTQNAVGEMRKLLRIGLSCCEEDVDVRCCVEEAVEKIEEVKERDDNER